MGKRILITEEERIEILSKYITENVIEEPKKGSIALNLYNRIKNKPTVKKLKSLADPDFKKFVANVVREFPKYKKNENEMVNQGLNILKNPNKFLEQNKSKVDQFASSRIAEQSGLAVLGVVSVLFLMLIIYSVLYGKKIEPIPTTEVNKKLEVLDGKTVNLYNDGAEQILFGTQIVGDFRFFDNSKRGGRSGVQFNLSHGVRTIYKKNVRIIDRYEIICLANPDRLADYIVRQGQYTNDFVYNKKFTDAVARIASPYCRRPYADFGVVSKPSSQNLS